MLRRIIPVGLLVVVAAALVASARAATISFRFTINSIVTECTESVALTGTVHAVLTSVDNGAGGFLVSSTFNPQGVTGVGLVSGRTYHGTGATTTIFRIGKGASETFVNNFRLISPGAGGDVIVHEVFHVTVNANGDLTAFVDQSTVACT